jgi:putative ABC transport system substrate-binding protein
MLRREFIWLLGGTAASWPIPARSQTALEVRRVGVFLGGSKPDDPEARLSLQTLQSSLQKLGWIEGRNVSFESRFSGGDPVLMNAYVAELLKLSPDVIVVRGNRPAALLKQATRTTPIVFAQVGDPVGSGLIDNLARPGGNVMGFTHFEPSMGGKWLEMLRDVTPGVNRVMIVMHPETPANTALLRVAEAVAPTLGVSLLPTGIHDAAEIERAIAAAAGQNTGMAVMPHDITVAHNRLIVALAMQHRLPAVYPYRLFVTQGGLMSYSFDTLDHWRQVATSVDRILRGEKPADLPVQAPTKFEMVVNLKTAKALGLTIPPAFLVRADEVIE